MNKTRGFNLKFFFLKKELYFHKIQYSKVLKYDVAAAIFGVVIGAFVVYLSLNTLGSGSPDLSDLSIFVWYFFLILMLYRLKLDDLKFFSNLFILIFNFFSFLLLSMLFCNFGFSL